MIVVRHGGKTNSCSMPCVVHGFGSFRNPDLLLPERMPGPLQESHDAVHVWEVGVTFSTALKPLNPKPQALKHF